MYNSPDSYTAAEFARDQRREANNEHAAAVKEAAINRIQTEMWNDDQMIMAATVRVMNNDPGEWAEAVRNKSNKEWAVKWMRDLISDEIDEMARTEWLEGR